MDLTGINVKQIGCACKCEGIVWKDYGEIFPNGLHLCSYLETQIYVNHLQQTRATFFKKKFQCNAALRCLGKFFFILVLKTGRNS